MNQSDKLYDLLEALSDASVKFVVCGGVACVLHGVERSTYDLDISASFEQNNLKKIIQIAQTFSLVPRIPEPVENLLDEKIRENWVKDKGALVYTFISESGPLQLDIFLSYPKSFEELCNNANSVKVDNFEFLISSKEDLIFAKEKIVPLRDKDILDIKELSNIKNNEGK